MIKNIIMFELHDTFLSSTLFGRQTICYITS